MGLPESSVRGFWIARAGLAVEASEDVARARRERFGDCAKCVFRDVICAEALRGRANGARKSK